MQGQKVENRALPGQGLRARLGGEGLRFAKKQPLGAAGLVMVVVVIVLAVFAPDVSNGTPNTDDYSARLKPPSASHWFGTDDFGRDLWTRMVYGARVSLEVGFIAVFTGSTLGLVLGVVTGYLGAGVDTIAQRIVEIMLSIPGLLLALALMATLGPGVDKVIIALAILYVPRTLRVVRGTVLSIKENVYIEAARTVGASPLRVMFRHVLPNVMAPYLIIASSLLGAAILTEATLSFLGLGVPPPHASWGRMLASSVATYAVSAPWMVIVPGLGITWLVLGFNLLGDSLRDVWDPRLRGR